MDIDKLMFDNQIDAAQRLYDILPVSEIIPKNPILLCSSLDSIMLTDFLAKKLKISYEIIFTEKIYAPQNNDCVVAMVSETEDIIKNDNLIDSFGISYDYIYGEGHRKYEEKILKNLYKYRKGQLIETLKNRNIILVDEGCETGITALVCIKSLLNLNVKSISYATPMIAENVAASLKGMVDQIFTVNKIRDFVEVDFYYKNKIPFDSEKIIMLLEESTFYLPLQKEGVKICNIPLK